MKNLLLRKVMKLNKYRRYRKGWKAAVRTMAIGVVFCTAYALILPAITVQADPICGIEAHTHTEECYALPKAELTGCGIGEDAIVIHQHADLCYDSEGILICTLPERIAHTHDDSCYASESVLNCPGGHVHSEACVRNVDTLVCELEETEGHTHTKACSGIQTVLTCACVPHEHGEGCYEERTVIVCETPETPMHTHSAACSGECTVLICGDESHAHDENCYELQTVVCEIPETAGHTHDENCSRVELVQVCTETPHAHGDGCYEMREAVCLISETEGHTHTEKCYTVTQIPCSEPAAEDHVHNEDCYQQTAKLICTLPELQLHSHDNACFNAEGTLICELSVVVEHIHTEACLETSANAGPVLICGHQEHTHGLECYPLEEETDVSLYDCGYALHTHSDSCYANDGTRVCTIPEHIHEAACVVEDLDLTADVEQQGQWEAELAELEFTGVWAEDLLTVAESQIGYEESKRNCILKNDQIRGYTRYGAWYGEAYGEWDDMFVAFCLHYAEIPEESVPRGSDTAKWIEKLAEEELFVSAESYTPVSGDLIFWDTDEDGEADKSGIVAEIDNEKKIKVIAGDTDKNRVETLNFVAEERKTIAGYTPLPMSTMSQDDWQASQNAADKLAELPGAESLKEALQKLNEVGDKAGYEALRQEATARMEAAEDAYNALDDDQKSRVTGMEYLDALKEICGGGNWKQFAALEEDGAALIQLVADDPEVISASGTEDAAEAVSEEETEAGEQETLAAAGNTVRSGDTVRYSFTATAESYYTDVNYGEARVKVELLLPLTKDKAVFDTEAMPWLEDAVRTTETRVLNETNVSCQVLTGYKKLEANETTGIVIPGSFTETVVVKVLNMGHGETLSVIISAAMEHNTWEGTCETHQTVEKLTVATNAIKACVPQNAQTQQANYEAFLLEAQDIEAQNLSDSDQYFAAVELMNRVAEAYSLGGLSDVQYDELSELYAALSDVNLSTIAEPCIGTNWMKIDFTESVVYGAEEATLTNYAQAFSLRSVAALSAETYSEVFPSAQQIDEEGGTNVSSDNAVMVSKTIEGTDVENVFDITLQIITQDEVNEVYKDPDMAVVVVMDISNTMRSDFGDVTRYQAAMTAGANFLKKFAEQNSTLSRVGYVAFNTSAHQIFDLSSCNTTAQANSLTSTMKSKTGSIINASGYADSRTRFTNMEAGLKMAASMLENVNNQHKYIIFISDGFPTTYVKSGTTGYEPFSSSGTKDNDGVFYDDTLNKWCLYGTSYSDTAAIKARKLAVDLKADGINIFSIGVDVGGQNLWDYHIQSVNGNGFSVVERRNEASYYTNNGYEIGTMHSEINKTSTTAAERAAMAQDFKDWLKGSTTSGIGSGYYYDSTDSDGLMKAYDEIFQKILELNASSAHLDWVASDPMPDMGVHEVEAMEFIGFWDLDENGEWVLVADDLTGESKDGNLYDNTADFHEDTQTIHWDVKNSGYVSQAAGNTTNYRCELRYRVRLKNEESVFVEGQSYDTNDVTSLTYRIIEVDGTTTTISEQRTVQFPIPAVHGYLSELNFRKVDPAGNVLPDAQFLLQHDTSVCNVCRGDGKNAVAVADMTAASDHSGLVSFRNIPSGHTYLLTETTAPDGFIKTTNTYRVVVAYDAQTVTVMDADGNVLEQQWNTDDPTIENEMYYALPETGGMGTSHFTFGGLLMIAAACVYYVTQFARKRRRGG